MSALLEIRNLSYFYGMVHALRDIDIVVNEGEIVTLIGANGAGKSTTLNAVSSLIPNSGIKGKSEILFRNKDITHLAANRVAKLGICQVPEGRHIFPRLTVEENLHVGAYVRNDAAGVKADVDEMFGQFPRLKERRRQEGGTLSGGEQQMLAIARGLMSKPKLLMLDEPSLGLAPIIVHEIFEIIRRINAENGIAILLVEQNSNLALRTASRGYVLETGNIALSGPCEQLINNEEVKKSYLGG